MVLAHLEKKKASEERTPPGIQSFTLLKDLRDVLSA